jgi:hypothetical protein
VITPSGRLKQEEHKFKARLSYIMRPVSGKKKVVTPIKNKIGQTVGSGDLRQMSECPIPHGEHPEEL